MPESTTPVAPSKFVPGLILGVVVGVFASFLVMLTVLIALGVGYAMASQPGSRHHQQCANQMGYPQNMQEYYRFPRCAMTLDGWSGITVPSQVAPALPVPEPGVAQPYNGDPAQGYNDPMTTPAAPDQSGMGSSSFGGSSDMPMMGVPELKPAQ